MKFKSFKDSSILGLVCFTLLSCGSANKSISCDGIKVYENLEKAQDEGWTKNPIVSFTVDQEKINVDFNGNLYSTQFADKSEITVEDTKIIINDDRELARKYLGEGPYELSLETCPSNLTSAVRYFIN